MCQNIGSHIVIESQAWVHPISDAPGRVSSIVNGTLGFLFLLETSFYRVADDLQSDYIIVFYRIQSKLFENVEVENYLFAEEPVPPRASHFHYYFNQGMSTHTHL